MEKPTKISRLAVWIKKTVIENRRVFSAMLEEFIIFVFTYGITLLCVLMTEEPETAKAVYDSGWLLWNLPPSDEAIVRDAIAATTITYSLSVILKNLFTSRRKLSVTTFSVGMCVVYTLIYVSTVHELMDDLKVFWGWTFFQILCVLFSELEILLHTHRAEKRDRFRKLFSE